MAHLTVRNVSDELVAALKRRATANGRSPEAAHRELLRVTMLRADEEFATRAAALRQQLRSSINSAETIRAMRDGAP